jgi:hypothetical protein
MASAPWPAPLQRRLNSGGNIRRASLPDPAAATAHQGPLLRADGQRRSADRCGSLSPPDTRLSICSI